MMTFPCIQCGECCRHAGEVPQLATKVDTDGVCRYLDKTQVIFGKIVRIFFELNAIASLKESTALGNQTLKKTIRNVSG